MKYLNTANGNPFYDWAGEEIYQHWDEIKPFWSVLVQAMDNEIREEVNLIFAPCTAQEFLVEYLKRAPQDLVIG